MWVNFAKNGNPSTSEHEWETYDTKDRKIMILDEEIKMEENYKSEQRELIEPLLKYYINANYAQMSFNVPHVYKLAIEFVGILLLIVGLIVMLVHYFK